MVVSSIIGFAPAVFLLYILLKRYEGFFKEKNVFLAFSAGLVVGMLITVFHLASDDFVLGHLDLSILVFGILFALFEESAKLVILNMPRYHRKFVTVYYGAGLGLGIGSMSIIAISFKLLLDNPGSLGDPLTMLGLIILSFNFSLLNSSTGIMIGFGCAKGLVLKYFYRAIFLHAAYNIILLPFMWGVPGADYGSLVLATLFAAALFWYVLTSILPEAVPPKDQKKRRRETRRRVREEKSN